MNMLESKALLGIYYTEKLMNGYLLVALISAKKTDHNFF
jgi:hypothetical protein